MEAMAAMTMKAVLILVFAVNGNAVHSQQIKVKDVKFCNDVAKPQALEDLKISKFNFAASGTCLPIQ